MVTMTFEKPRSREIGIITTPEDMGRLRVLNGGENPTATLSGEALDKFEAQEQDLHQQTRDVFLNELGWEEGELKTVAPWLFPDESVPYEL